MFLIQKQYLLQCLNPPKSPKMAKSQHELDFGDVDTWKIPPPTLKMKAYKVQTVYAFSILMIRKGCIWEVNKNKIFVLKANVRAN